MLKPNSYTIVVQSIMNFPPQQVQFDPHQDTELCAIMTRHGSDKGNNTWHNYTKLYHNFFSSFRYNPMNLFELGLGTNNTNFPSNMGEKGHPGASLRGWAEYFPNAKIYGADIDDGVLFQTPRIQTAYVDQTNPSTIAQLWSIFPQQFDIIIDDGLHEHHANMCFLRNSFHKLKPKGIYVIEDILQKDLHLFQTSLSEFGKPFMIYNLPGTPNPHDNVLAFIYNAPVEK